MGALKFNQVSQTMVQAMAAYEQLSAEKVRAKAQGQVLDADKKAQLGDAITYILSHADLIRIGAGSEFADLHDALSTGNKVDKVHPIQDTDDLKTRRLGGENANKRTFALAVKNDDGSRDLLAVIYTHWSKQDMMLDGTVAPENIPGDVASILNEDIVDLDDDPNTVIFYSISSFFPSAGPQLIKSLHAEFNKQAQTPFMSTLSPMRTFAGWLDEQGVDQFDDLSRDEKVTLVQDYLATGRDGVQNFHLSNGALMGDINLDSNAPGTADAEKGKGVMINYVYPRDPAVLAAQQNAYKADKMQAPHLRLSL